MRTSAVFLLGGGFDIVVASQRVTKILSGAYDGGPGGTFNRNFNQSVSGGGLQLKLGLQWAPIPKVRIGWMVGGGARPNARGQRVDRRLGLA